ncbi:LuxR family transcriptional regulator [Salinadaptatus halalkaliphilus]|uniref:LuxR family transcriptional regulator n=1 Tax=Salinadaptatus halalkaliphilus TaxID=2419781 RepID=A0A4S3TRB4_9EURY|nr:helix-turn-helix domain-containing protein [Salinadaptatus halalkaliphilus]THE65893.1 LuxR family transcriptional regulator [Salinadaptatus halalkaliphilus]
MSRSFVADVVIDHAELPLTPTLRAVPEIAVTVESQPTQRESPSIFYSVTGDDFAKFESALEDDPTVTDWQTSITDDECRLYQIAPSANTKFTTPKIADLGIRVLSLESVDGRWHFQLQAPDRDALGDYWQYCRDEGVAFELEKIYSSGPQPRPTGSEPLEAQLTDRQLEVVDTVTRMGYYDQDGATAKAVADELDISPSTLSTHIRRIMATMFEYLSEDG